MDIKYGISLEMKKASMLKITKYLSVAFMSFTCLAPVIAAGDTVTCELKGGVHNPTFQPGNFSATKINQQNQVYYTDFFMGGINHPQSVVEEGNPLPIDISITGDGRCKIVEPTDQEAVLRRVKLWRDGRKRIVDTTDLPYRFHGHMIMTFANGAQYTGSGTLVGPHHVLTAGHNLYSHTEGWATSVTFVPARNADNKPYGKIKGSVLLSSRQWTEDKNKEHDFGMVILDTPIGYRTGWAGLFSSNNDNDLRKKPVHVSGYPADKGNRGKESTELWTMSHAIKTISANVLHYDIDTYPGQSGSGVWTQLNGGYYVESIK